MADIVKYFLVPGSIPFFVVGLLLGVGLLYGSDRVKRWGRGWLTLLLLVYAFLSTPLGADFVSAPLERPFTAITAREQVRGIDTVVVLSTGGEVYGRYGEEVAEMGRATASNAIEAARLYRLFSPAAIVVSGGIVTPSTRRESEAEVLTAGLVRLGVPRERLVLESRSRTTREQAVNTAALLKKRGVRRFLLVTGGEHMPRARATFREQGLEPVPSVAPRRMATAPGLLQRLRPSLNALRQSDWACYEYLARIYYWKQGWLN